MVGRWEQRSTVTLSLEATTPKPVIGSPTIEGQLMPRCSVIGHHGTKCTDAVVGLLDEGAQGGLCQQVGIDGCDEVCAGSSMRRSG